MAREPRLAVRADDGFVVRTPLLPITLLDEWTRARDPRAFLAEIVGRPEVREAIHLASPGLAASIDAWRAAPASHARIEVALAKYASRMMTRATPFGLFAGISTGTLDRVTGVTLAPRAEYRRRTRLDNDYLFALADELAREAPPLLRYHPTTTRYPLGGRVRFAAARLDGTARTYELVAVEANRVLERLLASAEGGATRAELVAELAEEIGPAAESYVATAIGSQLLVPELGVQITGREPLDAFLDDLEHAEIAAPRAALAAVRDELAALDAGGLGHAVERYAHILAMVPGRAEPARLVQVDMVKPARATLGRRVAADLVRVIESLVKITPHRDPLADWRRAFLERWEDRRVPLATVLDEDSGIGFAVATAPGAEGAPLLAGMPFAGGQEAPWTWTPAHRHLLGRLTRALRERAEEIVLDDGDLAAMAPPRAAELPVAFGALARLVDTGMLFEGAHGPSGARLLGRFCHASPAVATLVRDHLAREEASRLGARFAEIVHLNEGRIGNVVCRPVLRGLEIPYLGRSGADAGAQIALDDLEVDVREERVRLWSRRLGVEIVPRLTTAHNFQLQTVGVYRFLCALAGQDGSEVAWHWGPLADAAFLPRVRLHGVIVSRARWLLGPAELAPVTEAVRRMRRDASAMHAVSAAVSALRRGCGLPRLLAVVAGDNELVIDLDNPILALTFADEIAGGTSVQVFEHLALASEVRGPEGTFANELVVTFTREAVRGAGPANVMSRVRREFAPGSEWLYAKVYCGEATADRVLRDVLESALATGAVERWFFVRYRDPSPHLRVRFAGEPAQLVGSVLPALERAVAPLIADGSVARLALDTYTRELERYGGDEGIAVVEEIFWRDSEAVGEILELLEHDAPDERWRLALCGVESLLAALGLSVQARAELAEESRTTLGREYRADRRLWTAIGERFARERAELEPIFDPRGRAALADHALAPGFEILARRDAAIAAAARRWPGVGKVAWSLAHMHVNRILASSQRAQELVLYDFLRRLHAGRAARDQPR